MKPFAMFRHRRLVAACGCAVILLVAQPAQAQNNRCSQGWRSGGRFSAFRVLSRGRNQQPATQEKWQPLFDGRSLAGWKPTRFGGQGEVTVEDGRILMDFGYSMTGITYEKEFPKTNYEIELEAMRVAGTDFFCGLTFPVAESYCSFIVGGWAGAVVGLSSIDDKDASENDTTKFVAFKTGRWYRIRVRVTDDRIRAWIDDKPMVDQDIRGKKVSTRNEVDLSQPLGIAAWETTSALRRIRWRPLDD